jgi:redox-sensitive bicupin YhaK (pirin superfamily)
MVGPFIFFDQMGPAEFLTNEGIDVRPHPHIGLATVTYLFEGEIFHRDSLGSQQPIKPGEVNWMIAGKGITHSERTAPDIRAANSSNLFGIQTWIALPEKDEEVDPGFEHHKEQTLPFLQEKDTSVRLILGNLYGERSPVRTFSNMFYADACLQAGAQLPLDTDHEDRGAYVINGRVEVAGQVFSAGQMLIFRPGDAITIKALDTSRLMLLGGDTFSGPRYIWWNFVASSQEKIEAAKEAWRQGDWQDGRFQLPPDDHDEFIPLPED